MRAIIAIAALLAACTGSAPAETAVTIEDFVYTPEAVTVPVGAAVTWTNEDIFGHTVTSGTPEDPDGRFDHTLGETTDGEGTQATVTFEEPGTYQYFCAFHPQMRGEVRVTDQ